MTGSGHVRGVLAPSVPLPTGPMGSVVLVAVGGYLLDGCGDDDGWTRVLPGMNVGGAASGPSRLTRRRSRLASTTSTRTAVDPGRTAGRHTMRSPCAARSRQKVSFQLSM